ncbi:MAG TPA: hypothetical protein VMV69_11675 [Pirellulales bacterium]|nr:hypothetical protein [Pirellulales bacterium]
MQIRLNETKKELRGLAFTRRSKLALIPRSVPRHNLRGRTVQLKVRYGDFHTFTRAQTLAVPTNVTQDIWETAAAMLAERLPARRLQVRLLGVGVSAFENPEQVQRSLFDNVEHERQGRLDGVADQIKEGFGTDALHRASGLLHGAEHRPVPRPGEQA